MSYIKEFAETIKEMKHLSTKRIVDTLCAKYDIEDTPKLREQIRLVKIGKVAGV